MSLSNSQRQALYVLLVTRSSFRLTFEGKGNGGSKAEQLDPKPVSNQACDPNYITKRFFDALNSQFLLNLTPDAADDKRVLRLYDTNGVDAGNPDPLHPAGPRKTNITRDADLIRAVFDPYDPSDPCPDDDDGPQDAIWDYYNGLLAAKRALFKFDATQQQQK